MATYTPPGGPDAGRVPDNANTAARQYARQRLMGLVRSGVLPRYLPEWDADPTKVWRAFSQQLSQQGYFNHPPPQPDANVYDNPGPALPPNFQLGSNLGTPPASVGVLPSPLALGGGLRGGDPGMTQPQPLPGMGTPDPRGQLFPGPGGLPEHMPGPVGGRAPVPIPGLRQGDANNNDWRNRIATMAHALNPSATTDRVAQLGQEFGFHGTSPAEAALNKMKHVHDVHRTARSLAHILGQARRTGY